MLDPKFYLGEGEFTKAGEISRDIARQLRGRHIVEGVDEFVRSLRYEKREDLFRKRTAEQIIGDYFLTGCTDAGLVFVTLARIKGLPAAYVETLKEDWLRSPAIPIEGHIFADVYQDASWVSYNPGGGKTEKYDKTYLWTPREPNRKYTEVARGLDFSQLYVGGKREPLQLKTADSILHLISKS